VNHEGINIVHLQVAQGCFQVNLDVFRPVVAVPELALDEYVLPLELTRAEHVLQGLSDLSLLQSQPSLRMKGVFAHIKKNELGEA
jgi:hypothetical protein